MVQRDPEGNQLIASYLHLRQFVGWIGTLLPIVLVVGNAIFSTASRPDSMSGYYYTGMRNVFVGALCALGVFLIAYDGHDEVDRWVTNIAGLGAIGVALCPTKPALPQLSAGQQVVGDLHLVFATVTFIALGFMALRFAKPDGEPRHYAADNVIYRACGVTILSCVLLAAASNLLPASVKAHWPLLFIFEAVAVFTFGFSWFVKGQTIQALRARRQARRDHPETAGAVQ
jgi:hypothetical protein